ncbi:MAG: hypothetical protein A2176_01795 [Spirochaetes bacterium RBG_13_51_14]|nr:MAG: hypothetical protein A2176_01795 [Spirochaetes bacterium RBG_13_51_14]
MNPNNNKVAVGILAAVMIGPCGMTPSVLPFGFAGVAAIGPAPLHAAEKNIKREISDLVDSVLSAEDEAVRHEYIKKLRTYPPEEVGSCWLELLNDTGRLGLKVRIIDQMSEYNDKRFVMPLAQYLISPHNPIRKSAARALKKIGDDRLYPVILGMVNSDTPVHRIYFIEAMNYLYDRRFFPSLINLLRDDNKSVRIYVLNCLKENRITESLVMMRGAALGDKNDEVRIAAIDAIGALRDGNALGVLHAVLSDKNRDVRCESARVLSLFSSPASVVPISYRLLVEDDNEIKELMIGTLAALRQAGDIRGLEKIMLNDGNSALRIRSAYVLGFSGSLQALMALRRGLADDDYRVRAEVCNSLGNYRNRLALASLFEVLEKRDLVYVRSAALYSIKRINDKSSLMGLFDLYTREGDPIFKEMLRDAIREYIKRFI